VREEEKLKKKEQLEKEMYHRLKLYISERAIQ